MYGKGRCIIKMIRIYSDENKLPKGYESLGDIWNIRAYFENNVFTSKFDKVDVDIVKAIDRAEVYSKNIFKTPYGIIPKDKLSSGSITALVLNHMKKNNITGLAVSVMSCGPNALSMIYDIINDTNLIIIQQPMYMGDAQTKHQISYDDKFKGNIRDYRLHLIELSYEEEDD